MATLAELRTFASALGRGLSQVVLQEHAGAGALIAVGLLHGAAPVVSLGGALGLLISTLVGRLAFDRATYERGLYGFNGVLIGLALPTFVAMTPVAWAMLVGLSAGSSALVAAWGRSRLGKSGMPLLTTPFVALTWIAVAGLGARAAGTAASLEAAPLLAILRAIGQIFLVGDAATGAIILFALFWAKKGAGAYALGAASGVALPLWLVAGGPGLGEALGVIDGTFGYNVVLVAIGCEALGLARGNRGVVSTVVAGLLALLLQLAWRSTLPAAPVPLLTAPFILAVWAAYAWSPWAAPRERPSPTTAH